MGLAGLPLKCPKGFYYVMGNCLKGLACPPGYVDYMDTCRPLTGNYNYKNLSCSNVFIYHVFI